MTTIAFKEGILAGDKMSVNGNLKYARVTKVHKINGCLCAIAGPYDIGMEMLHWFQEGAEPDDFPGIQMETNESTLLVITPERRITLYERSPIPLIFEQEVVAIGSGRDFALAAMELGCSAEEAVRVAMKLDAYTGGDVDVITFEQH